MLIHQTASHGYYCISVTFLWMYNKQIRVCTTSCVYEDASNQYNIAMLFFILYLERNKNHTQYSYLSLCKQSISHFPTAMIEQVHV